MIQASFKGQEGVDAEGVEVEAVGVEAVGVEVATTTTVVVATAVVERMVTRRVVKRKKIQLIITRGMLICGMEIYLMLMVRRWNTQPEGLTTLSSRLSRYQSTKELIS